MNTAPQRLRLLLGGDAMTGRGLDQVLRRPVDPTLHEPWVRDARDYVRLAEATSGPIGRGLPDEAPWGVALERLRAPDVTLRLVNLETAITARGEPWPGKGIHYRMHPVHVGVLTGAGLDGCALANNHVLDWGPDGLRDTLRALANAGLRVAGAGADDAAAWAPAEFDVGAGSTVRMLSCATPDCGVPAGWAAGPGRAGIALLPDLSAASVRRVADALAAHAPGRRPIAVLSIHWGGNWPDRPTEAQRRFARALVDTGAVDVVHGHSSHWPMPIEVHHGRAILYGCGDLLNDYEGIAPEQGRRSDAVCLYQLELDAADGRLLDLEVVPLRLRRFRLAEADDDARAWLQARLRGGPGSARVSASADGRWRLAWEAG